MIPRARPIGEPRAAASRARRRPGTRAARACPFSSTPDLGEVTRAAARAPALAKPVRTTPEGSDELHAAPPPFLLIARRETCRGSAKPSRTRVARRERPRRVHDLQAGAVLRLHAVAVHRPAHVLPVQAAGERDSASAVSAVEVDQRVRAARRGRRGARLDLEVEVDRRPGWAAARRARWPRSSSSSRAPASARAAPSQPCRPGPVARTVAITSGTRTGARGAAPSAARRAAHRRVHELRRVALAAREEAHGDDEEQRRQRQDQRAIEHQRDAVELEDADVAPHRRRPTGPSS